MLRIGFVVLPGFQVMSVAVLSVFEFANKEMRELVYDLHLLSETGGSGPSSLGFFVATKPFNNTNFDTLIFGGRAAKGTLTPGVVKIFRPALGRRRRGAPPGVGA